MRSTVYLGGKMTGLTFEEMILWRRKATNVLQINGFRVNDPTSNLHNDEIEMLESSKFDTPCKEVVATNVYMIKRSDIILLEFENQALSVGTVCEAICAAREFQKPVVAFGKHPVLAHPWLMENVSARRDTLDEALEYITRTFGGE